jgi:hypothetical protein
MAMRDITNNLHVLQAIAPVAARTDDTAIVSSIIDVRGYDSLMFAISIGTNTDADATFTALVEEGDVSNLSDAAAVADADLNGTEALASWTFADDTETRKIGYRGSKRYVRLTITPSGNGAGNIFLAGVAILGNAHLGPTANPPV